MSVFVSFRLRRIVRRLAYGRVGLILVFFTVSWLVSAALFYYSEHVRAGRHDVDFEASLYWALITMATVGYGDITPSRGLGWVVAGLTAVLGIGVYTLFISTVAERFMDATVRKALGLGGLKGKRIILVGGGPFCEEALRELERNGLLAVTGLVLESQPSHPLEADYTVGPLSLRTLAKAGVGSAESVILCSDDDSRNVHAAALVRRLNPRARIASVYRDESARDILELLGVNVLIPVSILGRLLASGGFEPGVVRFVSEATTAAGKIDLREVVVTGDPEEAVRNAESTGIIIAIVRGGEVLLPEEAGRPRRGDRIIVLARGREEA